MSRALRAWIGLVATLLVALAVLARPVAAAPRLRPIAVLIGANAAAPGRQPLRFALSDAELMASTLARTGRFAPRDIITLLEPGPAEIVVALERVARELEGASGEQALFVFYYSGHSDGQHLFPRGESLSLVDLRAIIARSPARIRVAILDTCRGGGWTGAKGLSVGPPLSALDLMSVDAAGTALLSSSSGLENAHEASVYGGSFFTHHVAAGLLGAADASGDGSVTLQEVFNYAKERTVRDSAHMALTTQHPSFEIELRGRQDIVLADVATSPSILEVSQEHALEIVHLESGVTALETLPDQKQVRLALPAGHYVVRRVNDGQVLSKDVHIEPGRTLVLDERELQASRERLAFKGDAPEADRPLPPSAHGTLPAGDWEVRLAFGATTGPARAFGASLYTTGNDPDAPIEREFDGLAAITYAITDRLSWSVPLPAFTYRFGTEGAFEALLRGGLTALGYSGIEGLLGSADIGLAARVWAGQSVTLVGNVSADYSFGSDADERLLGLLATAGLQWRAADRVSFALGAGWHGGVEVKDPPAGEASGDVGLALVLGAVQALGYRPLPLVQVYLAPTFSLDAYATWAVNVRDGDVWERYLGGFTWVF